MIQKGFTIIELTIVVAVVALLSTIVLLALNPAELLRKSRDATRLSDMSMLKSAISLYLASVSSPSLGAAATCYTSNAATTERCGGLFSAVYTATSATTSRGVSGTDGWLPVNFRSISSGAPFGTLPIDPRNDATYYYAYAASTTSATFELNVNMESSKYMRGGAGDVESTDNGDNIDWYETGTARNLAL